MSELATSIELHDKGANGAWRDLMLSDIGKEKMERVRALTQQLLAVTISSEVNVLVLGIMLVVFVVAAPKGIIGLLRPRYRLRAGGGKT